MVSRRKSDEWRKPDRKATVRRARERDPEKYVPDRSDVERDMALNGPTGEINALLAAVMDTRKQDGKTYLVFRRATTLIGSSAPMLRQMMGKVGEDDNGNMLVEAGKFFTYCQNKLVAHPNATVTQRMQELMQKLNISPQMQSGH